MALHQPSRQISRPFSRTMATRAVAPLDALWRWCTRPLLLLLLATLTLALTLAGRLLPQLPANLQGDATETSRWLLNSSAQLGTPGDILRGLGLFDVLTSPLLRWLLLLLAALLVLQLGRQLGSALQMRRVQRLRLDDLREPTRSGEPVALPVAAPHRLRTTHDSPPDVLLVAVRAELTRRFGHVDELRVQEISIQERDAADESERVDVVEEMRLLATRDLRASGLRPLLALGLGLALASAWWVAGQSWSAISPPLVPGDSFARPAQNFRVQYVVLEPAETATADDSQGEADGATPGVPAFALRLQSGDVTRELPLTQPDMHLSLSGVRVRALVVAPGLFVRTVDGSARLVALGGSDFQRAVGLAFPSANFGVTVQQGSEAALEFVRVDKADAGTRFDVKITPLAPEGKPHSEAIAGAVQTIDGGGALLEVVRVPSVQVVARHTPGLWLLWPAGLLVAAGLVGLWRRPAFALVQIVPWPGGRTVVVAQGSGRGALAGLENIHGRD